MKRPVSWILFLAALVALGGSLSASHFLTYDSVDSGEIRWDDSSAYDDALTWANARWDALGTINIEADSAFVVADVEYFDRNEPSAAWDGRYINRTGTDAIEFNTAYFASYTTSKRRTVATHELGHALGLGDHTSSDSVSASATIMWHCSTCSGLTSPSSHDINDYNIKW